MESVRFSEILEVLGLKLEIADFEITGISTDSRSISSGELFIAFNGPTYCGSDFIDVAIKKGASAIITNDERREDETFFEGDYARNNEKNVPLLLVPDTVEAFQKIAAFYRSRFQIPVVAITGSSGKTTTRNMLYTILSAKHSVLTPEKNFNNGIGLPTTLLKLSKAHEYAVLELGMNHPGEIDLLSGIAKPSIAIITNIGQAHIGNLGSQENIKQAKLEIVSGLSENGILIVNGEDPFLKDVAFEHIEVCRIGNCEGSKLRAKNVRMNEAGITFTLYDEEQSADCKLSIIGEHNVCNALEAVYCAMRLGISLQEACAALSNYEAVSMRNEPAYDKGIFILKDYYNASPESMRAAVKTLKALTTYKKAGKKIAILGQMNELGSFSPGIHRELAELCRDAGLDYVFFIGDDYDSFEEGLGDSKGKCFPADARQELQAALLEFVSSGALNSGDTVLMKGARDCKMEEFYENLKAYINSYISDFTALPPSPTRLYVDINAMKHNFLQISRSLENDVQIMPMVKANAYGCGVDIIANVFKDCKYLAVADVKEASLIRRNLPNVKIMIIYQPLIEDIKEIVSAEYVCGVGDIDFAKALNEEAGSKGKICKIHIEIDTGATRLGIIPEESTAFAEEIKKLPNLQLDGIFMHYVCADSFTESDLEFTALQTRRFADAVEQIERVLGPAPHKHACAGAAIFNRNAMHYNMVRPGYMLYGYYPSPELEKMVDLQPAMKFASKILRIREVEAGTPISYNRRFVTKRPTKVATVAVGYSDGILRKLFHADGSPSGCFVVNGQRAPIVGSICMDMTMIDITDIEGEVKVGDEVFIFDNINVTLDEMADLCDTIGYEILARIEDKADRVESF